MTVFYRFENQPRGRVWKRGGRIKGWDVSSCERRFDRIGEEFIAWNEKNAGYYF